MVDVVELAMQIGRYIRAITQRLAKNHLDARKCGVTLGCVDEPVSASDRLKALTRKPNRAGDRRVLDEIFDRCRVATVSTVIGDEPWVVPMLVVRDGDELLLHGSTGAGALRQVAEGAKVAVSAFLFDGLVVAERAFDHSANYRSAVVRGVCGQVEGDDLTRVLDHFTDALIPGRSAECPAHTPRELAQTLVLRLPIRPGNWIAKQRSGPPADAALGHWTGVVPVAQTLGAPVSTSSAPVPESVRRLVSTEGT
jgi:nitroimidazol reductase NimA-like FMN-containing flavoprotein (pyridoxamine 5'-phosphate oxidase superfamily)